MRLICPSVADNEIEFHEISRDETALIGCPESMTKKIKRKNNESH